MNRVHLAILHNVNTKIYTSVITTSFVKQNLKEGVLLFQLHKSNTLLFQLHTISIALQFKHYSPYSGGSGNFERRFQIDKKRQPPFELETKRSLPAL